MAVGVRAKLALMSHDAQQLIVLEGTPGEIVAVEGSPARPRFRVVFSSAIAVGLDVRPGLVRDRVELVVGLEDLVLDAAVTPGIPSAGNAEHDRTGAEVSDAVDVVGS